jgi:HEPN domain-containing protein
MNLPHDWLNHAKSDLRLSKLAWKEGILPEQICFHAQQAAEKALKAVLVHKNVDFPFTHDLDQLVEVAKHAGMTIPEKLHDIGILTPYAVQTRYPGFWGEISDAEVGEAVDLAEETLIWASALIGIGPNDKQET